MAISLEDVKRIARLSRIEISEMEASIMLEQLSGIFKLIEQMHEINTTDINPMNYAQDVSLRLRPDEITESNQRALLQSGAPQIEDGLYLVPKIIE